MLHIIRICVVQRLSHNLMDLRLRKPLLTNPYNCSILSPTAPPICPTSPTLHIPSYMPLSYSLVFVYSRQNLARTNQWDCSYRISSASELNAIEANAGRCANLLCCFFRCCGVRTFEVSLSADSLSASCFAYEVACLLPFLLPFFLYLFLSSLFLFLVWVVGSECMVIG